METMETLNLSVSHVSDHLFYSACHITFRIHFSLLSCGEEGMAIARQLGEASAMGETTTFLNFCKLDKLVSWIFFKKT